MEDFSQSRGDDDLFDDEITPFEHPQPSQNITSQLEQVSLQPEAMSIPPRVEVISAAVPAPQAATKPPTSTSHENESPLPGFRQRQRGRGGLQTGRVGGAARRPAGGLEESKWASAPAEASQKSTPRPGRPTKPSVHEPPPPSAQVEPTTTVEPSPTEEDTPSTPQPDSTTAPPQAPTGPSTTQPTKTPAVRGDRTLTGGPARTKLTEEELTAKLSAAKERSQNVAAAHARAQADAASFEERERVANQKRVVERKERKVMEGERERNRLRKLGGREGREWDRDKEDVNQSGSGRGRGRGGVYAEYGAKGFTGGQAEDDDLRQYEWHDDRGRGRGRGRGGRGDRGTGRGRGGPRGGGYTQGSNQRQAEVPADTDFPALPGSTAPSGALKKDNPEQQAQTSSVSNASKPKPQRWDSGGGGGTWADQVESSELNG